MASNSNSLWAKILKKRYCEKDKFLDSEIQQHHSPGWKDIISTRDFIKQNSCYSIGDGKEVNLFTDSWIGPSICLADEGARDFKGVLVKDIMIDSAREWESQRIIDFCGEDWVTPIRRKKIAQRIHNDSLCWTACVNGIFSVKTALRRLTQAQEDPNEQMWKRLSKLKIHERAKFFLWRLATNCFILGPLLVRRGLSVDPICRSCGVEEETTAHVFFRCEQAKGFWLAEGLGRSWNWSNQSEGVAILRRCWSSTMI